MRRSAFPHLQAIAGVVLLAACTVDPAQPDEQGVRPQLAVGPYSSMVDLSALAGMSGATGRANKVNTARLAVGSLGGRPFTWQLPNGPFQFVGSAGGEVVGVSSDGAFLTGLTGSSAGVIWGPTRVATALNWSGPIRPLSVNRNGQSVGGIELSPGLTHAFRADRFGSVTDLGTLRGDLSSYAWDIRDDGTVVGWSADAAGTSRMVMWSPRGTISLLTPGTMAAAINDGGQIAGTVGQPQSGMTWSRGTVVLHQATNIAWSLPQDINGGGLAVGYAGDLGGKTRGYAADVTGAMTLLPRGSALYHYAFGIDDCGDVVGQGVFGSVDVRPVWWPGAGCQ